MLVSNDTTVVMDLLGKCEVLDQEWILSCHRPQRGLHDALGPLGGAFLKPRPMGVVDYFSAFSFVLTFRPRPIDFRFPIADFGLPNPYS